MPTPEGVAPSVEVDAEVIAERVAEGLDTKQVSHLERGRELRGQAAESVKRGFSKLGGSIGKFWGGLGKLIGSGADKGSAYAFAGAEMAASAVAGGHPMLRAGV